MNPAAPLVRLAVVFASIWSVSNSARAAERYIAENGQAGAEIVIAEKPARTVRLAAADLQTSIEKISGAHLPIVTEPSGKAVKLFVGRSTHTDRLGITAEGLKYGAYRLVSGEDWLAFIGDDTEFVPREPWPRSNRDIASGDLQRAWETASGGPWRVPNTHMWKDREKVPASVGLPDAAPRPARNESFEIWAYDEQGSFNAVSAYLQKLGVRWLMPGELGEFVPELKSIALPKLDETVHPDFEIRQFSIHGPSDWTRWGMRLGVRYPYGMNTAHGMSRLSTPQIFEAHPDWFAMYGGARRFVPGENNHFCYSNEGLLQETVRCVRAQFDVYDFEAVSVMPPDAYTSICQCPLCEGKSQPERGSRGSLSNHVWDFVNRVAKEVAKTHPQKLIYCCAYGANSLPPTNIDKLEPNVQVVIVGGRRPKSGVQQQDEIRAFRESWLPKTDRPIQIYENYPLTSRGWYQPCFMARTIGSSINETKGTSRGEEVWINAVQEFNGTAAFNAFGYYFTARMYWGGKQQDVASLLDEYCRLMYGPAADEMKAFFDYCEINWQDMETDKSKVDASLAMFEAAKVKVESSTREAQRLAFLDEFLDRLRAKSVQLAQNRGAVPKLRLVGEPKNIVIDGKLDEEFWQDWRGSAVGRMRETQTGREPTFATGVKVGWQGSDLYFAVRCSERSDERPNVTATKNGDQALWYGDCVEFLIETDSHSYYQIAVNPAGAIVDFDRGADKKSWDTWDSKAEVATEIGDGYWTVEIRIPVTDDENDPLHLVVGHKPSTSLPWHVNVCRQRVRENGIENSAYSPTGASGFHYPERFAHLHAGLSHEFDADPSVTTYVSAAKAAAALPKGESIEAFVSLADGVNGKVTPFQQAAALKQAAATARTLKDFARADELAARIPVEAERKTAEMLNLLAQKKAKEVIERFGDEDLTRWPFWAAAEGYLARGRAYAAVGDKDAAEADFTAALPLAGDPRLRKDLTESIDKLRGTK
jgi:hypothetical protein